MIRDMISKEAIAVKYNSKLFGELTKIIKDFQEISRLEFAYDSGNTTKHVNSKYPKDSAVSALIDTLSKDDDSKINVNKFFDNEMKNAVKFAILCLKNKITDCIRKNTGIELTRFIILPDATVNAFAGYSASHFNISKTLTSDTARIRRDIYTASDIAVDHIKNFINSRYYDVAYAEIPRVAELSLTVGLIYAHILYEEIIEEPWLPEYTAEVILHEIGHLFYVLDVTQRSSSLMQIITEAADLVQKTPITNYDDLLKILNSTDRSLTSLLNMITHGKYVDDVQQFAILNPKLVKNVLQSLQQCINVFEDMKKSNTEFDQNKANYYAIIYSNTASVYWKNVLYAYWDASTAYLDYANNTSFNKNNEQFADEFAVKNGGGKYVFKATRLISKLSYAYVVVWNDANGELYYITKFSCLLTLYDKVGKYFNIFNSTPAYGGVYDNPYKRSERIVQHLYPMLNDPTVKPAVKKQIFNEITELRQYIEDIRQASGFMFSVGFYKFLSTLRLIIFKPFDDIITIMQKDYAQLQDFTFDLIKNELPYQRDRLKQLIR